jgi:hypothetical protein
VEFLKNVARVLLGLFVSWQLLFLLVSNLLGTLQDIRPHLVGQLPAVAQVAPAWSNGEGSVHAALQRTTRAARRYAELTGQPQDWSLFAPAVAHEVPFLAVELRWDDPSGQDRTSALPRPVWLLSDNEPPDPNRFLRVGNFRLRRFEGTIDLEKVAPDWRAILAYLRWRWDRVRSERPDWPVPKQVILCVRTYHIPPPPGPRPWTWIWEPPDADRPQSQPVARWQPGAAPDPSYLPIEKYDADSRTFERLPVPE